MITFVLRKIRSVGLYQLLALVIPVIMMFVIIMKAKDDVTPEPEKNKLQSLITGISYYIPKALRPQPLEEPKYSFFQRMCFWNYFN